MFLSGIENETLALAEMCYVTNKVPGESLELELGQRGCSPDWMGWKEDPEGSSAGGCLSQPRGSASPQICHCSTRKKGASKTRHPGKQPGAAGLPGPRPPAYPADRASGPGEAPGLKVPVAVALGMSLRSSRTQVATSMFICRAR